MHQWQEINNQLADVIVVFNITEKGLEDQYKLRRIQNLMNQPSLTYEQLPIRDGLSSLDLNAEYRTGSCEPISQFYTPCLTKAKIYKRAVGYFRSSIYLLIGTAVVKFAQNGGKIFLICSPDLNEKDVDAISNGYVERDEQISKNLIAQFEDLLNNTQTNQPTRMLATLIALGILEIKVAWRPNAHGLYHEKIGVFLDEYDNRVSFIGSANESWSGWDARGNFESVEVFCSWKHENERERSLRHEANFDNLWAGLDPEAETIAFPEAVSRHLCSYSLGTLDEVEKTLTESVLNQLPSQKRNLLPHQIAAIDAWNKQGKRGIFEHATGSGKTFTALEAAKSHLAKGMPVLILVPSQLLLKQWDKEVRTETSQAAIILAGSGNNRWKESGRLKRFSSAIPTGPRIILSTMQTAATDLFRRELSQGNHLMIIADEVHQIGSHFNSQCLSIQSGPRLGLSATPKRYGDQIGTERIIEYFGPIVSPKITLADAVKVGRLVEYEYFPHPVHLTDEEAQEWKALTRKISFEIAKSKSSEGGVLSEKAKMLILRRSRIAKKAIGKVDLASKILEDNFEEGQSWLIYCEDSSQLATVMQALNEVGIKSIEYHTNMEGSQSATLDWFRKFGGVLVSIKCLDEGVDIPSVSHALILASSQNPRQFIQRRGRVLRKSPGKQIAVIHDVLVVPLKLVDEPEQTALLKSEFLRAVEFSDSALNKTAGARLREMAREIGFDPDETGEEGIEEEGEE